MSLNVKGKPRKGNTCVLGVECSLFVNKFLKRKKEKHLICNCYQIYQNEEKTLLEFEIENKATLCHRRDHQLQILWGSPFIRGYSTIKYRVHHLLSTSLLHITYKN